MNGEDYRDGYRDGKYEAMAELRDFVAAQSNEYFSKLEFLKKCAEIEAQLEFEDD